MRGVAQRRDRVRRSRVGAASVVLNARSAVRLVTRFGFELAVEPRAEARDFLARQDRHHAPT